MSYILDALKKAERERGLTQVPTVMTVHDLRGTRANRRALAASGLLVCAAALVWFFLRSQNSFVQVQQTAPSTASPAQSRMPGPPEAAPIQGGDSVRSLPALHKDEATDRPAQVRSKRPDSAAASGGPSAPRSTAGSKSEVAASPAAETAKAPQPRAWDLQPEGGERLPARSPVEPPSSPPSDKTMTPSGAITGIPAAKEAAPAPASTEASQKTLRDAMAKMTLNILVFEEAESQRKVYINGKKYVKGDLVDGLYLVESITLEGVVLSYQGERALLRPN